jgi:AcrR family transcriptional regulator
LFMPLSRRSISRERRQPKQRRARETVEAILDAVVKILKRDGIDAVTTNRIAEVAGVSVGSIYQYFPDKRAIFVALHDRHVERSAGIVERTLVERADAPLEDLLRVVLAALIDAHTPDPELYGLLATEVPHRAAEGPSFQVRLRNALRLAIEARAGPPATHRELEQTLFVVAHMVDSLAHGAALDRPPQVSLATAKEEAARALLAYLRA